MADQKNQLASIDRFTNRVMDCYGDDSNGMEITQQEKDCIKSYFLAIDLALKNSKEGYTWSMVKLDELAPRLKHYARLGLSMDLDNHLFPIPYKSGNSGKITMNLLLGYKGRQYIATKFAVNPPKDFIVHLVGEKDKFTAIYKDANHPNDNYIFETNPFDKGTICGGFCYVEYEDSSLNKLTVMSLEEIMKHKPERASNQFWGGAWKNKMYAKTLVIEACKGIALDPEKIRLYKPDLDQIDADELNAVSVESNAVADEKTGTGDIIDIEDYDEVSEGYTPVADKETGEVRLEV